MTVIGAAFCFIYDLLAVEVPKIDFALSAHKCMNRERLMAAFNYPNLL